MGEGRESEGSGTGEFEYLGSPGLADGICLSRIAPVFKEEYGGIGTGDSVREVGATALPKLGIGTGLCDNCEAGCGFGA